MKPAVVNNKTQKAIIFTQEHGGFPMSFCLVFIYLPPFTVLTAVCGSTDVLEVTPHRISAEDLSGERPHVAARLQNLVFN